VNEGDGRAARAAALAVALLALLVFARTFDFGFLIWDDDQHVTANARLDPPTPASLWTFWQAPFLGLYVPVSYTLFWFEAWITNGPDPRVFHGVSVLLHAANAALVVALLTRVGARPFGAAIGGLVFALHPLQVESVAWISEQRGLLAAFFGLAGLCLYASPRRGAGRDVATGGLMLLALLAKPSAVVVPAVALVLEALILRRGLRYAAPRLAVGFLAAIACLAVTKGLQSDEIVRDVVPLWHRPLVALDAFEFYVRHTAWPLALAPDHGRTPTLVVGHGLDGSLVATAIATLVLVLVPRFRAHALAPLLVFAAVLAPVLGLVPFSHQGISTVADRYAYLALLGPALFVALFATRAWPTRTPSLATAVAAILAGVLGVASFVQASHWRSTDTIFAHTLVVNPRSWIAHTNRGLVFQNRGDLAAARVEYEAAIGAKPDHARALNNLGILLVQQGQAAEGEAFVRRSMEADPRYARPHMNLAAILGNQGRFDEAEVSARRAVELAPDDPTMHTTLGNVHLRVGRMLDARRDFEAARALRPRDPEAWFGIGLTQKATGDVDAAAASFATALELARARSPGRVRAIESEIEHLRAP
jgi:Flp pilus assembly protein TadD